VTYFAEIGKFQKERWMSPKQLKEYNKNKKEYEKKYSQVIRQYEGIQTEVIQKRIKK